MNTNNTIPNPTVMYGTLPYMAGIYKSDLPLPQQVPEVPYGQTNNVGTVYMPNRVLDEAKHPIEYPSGTTNTHTFILDSRDRDVLISPNANQQVWYLGPNPNAPASIASGTGRSEIQGAPYKNVASLELMAASLPRTEYNINESNDQIDYCLTTNCTAVTDVSTTASLSYVTVTSAAHGLVAGNTVCVHMASTNIGGIPQREINDIVHNVSSSTANTFTFPVTTTASSTATGGGLTWWGEERTATLTQGRYAKDIGSYALQQTITIVAGPPSTITRAVGSFIDDGFVVGDDIVFHNCVNAANNNTAIRIAGVAALVLTVKVGQTLVAEAASTNVSLCSGFVGAVQKIVQDDVNPTVAAGNPIIRVTKSKGNSLTEHERRLYIENTDVVGNHRMYFLWRSGTHRKLSAHEPMGFSFYDAPEDGPNIDITSSQDCNLYCDPNFCIVEIVNLNRNIEATSDGITRSFGIMYFDNVEDTFVTNVSKGSDFDRKILYFQPPMPVLDRLEIRFKKHGNFPYHFHEGETSLIFEVRCLEHSFKP